MSLGRATAVGDLPMRFSHFLDRVDVFDAAVFGVPAPEAVMMDPQQRLLLGCVAEAWKGASSGLEATGEKTGVFVGVSWDDYGDFGKAAAGPTAYTATGASLSVASGRVAFCFGFKGPCVTGMYSCINYSSVESK